MKRFLHKNIQITRALLDDREECFKKLNENLIAVLKFKAYVV